MADNKVSSSEPRINGTSAAAAAHPFTKAFVDPIERVEAAFEQMAKMQAQSLEQAKKNVDEAARLAKESIAYAEQLGAQWRAISFDAARRTAEIFSPKA